MLLGSVFILFHSFIHFFCACLAAHCISCMDCGYFWFLYWRINHKIRIMIASPVQCLACLTSCDCNFIILACVVNFHFRVPVTYWSLVQDFITENKEHVCLLMRKSMRACPKPR